MLPHEREHTPRGRDADDVQDHRLQRQQQRAERTREQHERDQRDQRDHQWEVAVHRFDEVVVLRREAAQAHVASGFAHVCADAIERVAPGGRGAVGNREGVDDGGVGVTPRGPVWGDRTVHALDARQRARDGVRRARAFHQHLVRQQRSGADLRVLEREQTLLGVALLGDGVEVGEPELQARRGNQERDEHRRRAQHRDPATPHDEVRP